MRCRFIFIFFLLLFSHPALALPWEHLRVLALTANGDIALHIGPSLIENVLLDESPKGKESILLNPQQEHPILICRLRANDSARYQIAFDAGQSGDPTFWIHRIEASGVLTQIFSVNALKLYLPGNDAIYSEGHTNNLFNQKRKFELARGAIREVKQPFYYVGIKGKLYKEFTLYSDANLQNVVARLPVNAQVEVLLAEATDFYKPKLLLKTDFGLTGWVEVIGAQYDWAEKKPGEFSGNGIQGIFYAGD